MRGGPFGAPPDVVNAVLDALVPLGIEAVDMPLKPEKIWALLQAARQGMIEQPDVNPPQIFETDEGSQKGECRILCERLHDAGYQVMFIL